MEAARRRKKSWRGVGSIQTDEKQTAIEIQDLIQRRSESGGKQNNVYTLRKVYTLYKIFTIYRFMTKLLGDCFSKGRYFFDVSVSPEMKRESVLRMSRWKLFCCAAVNSGQSTSAVDGAAARTVSISICGVVSGAAKSISLRVIINADSLLLHPHGA